MSFQIKDFASIALGMINHAKATQSNVTDFNIGSVARTLIEAPAIEIDELYQRMLAGIIDAIPVAVYNAFSFVPVDAVKSRGTVTIAFSDPVNEAFTIPAGTIFRSSTANYLSESATVVPVDATQVSLFVVCDTAGTVGNTGSNTIVAIAGLTLPNTATIGNEPILSGSDSESDSERMSRFNDYIRSLARGTPYSVLYAAKSAKIVNINGSVVDYVSRAGIVESPGHVYVYIYGGNGAASNELITEAQSIIDGYRTETGDYVPGYRPAGMRVEVVSMTNQLVNISLSIKLFTGGIDVPALESEIRSNLERLLFNIQSGDILYAAAITESVLSVSGVQEAYISNNANIVCDQSKVLKLNTLTFTYL